MPQTERIPASHQVKRLESAEQNLTPDGYEFFAYVGIGLIAASVSDRQNRKKFAAVGTALIVASTLLKNPADGYIAAGKSHSLI